MIDKTLSFAITFSALLRLSLTASASEKGFYD